MKTQTKKVSKKIFRIICMAILALIVIAVAAAIVFFLTYRAQLSKLKVYRGAEHPHGAQTPKTYTLDQVAQ